MNNLTVGGIIQNGILLGLKNAASLLGAVALWLLTVWIPYLNVGTTIGLLGLVAAMSKGEVISPTEIFRADYRKQMGEFFLVQAFLSIGVAIGSAFLVIPGVVIAFAWCLAPLLVIDKSVNPTEALQQSNNLTTGKKWTMFFGMVLTSLAAFAGVMLISVVFGKIHAVLGGLFGLIGFVLVVSISMGAQAYIYGTLTGSSPGSSDVKDAPVIGGAIGAIVVSFILVALIGGSGGHASSHRDYAAMPSTSSVNTKSDYGLDMTDPAPSRSRNVAPALDEDPPPPTRNVATAKSHRRGK
jgi:hypothetical protein